MTKLTIGNLTTPPNLVFSSQEDRYNVGDAPHSILVYRSAQHYKHKSVPTPLCARLMLVNDETDVPDSNREAELTKLFAEADIEVEFVG